jgi:RND superfamily putative drug exporter
VTAVALVVTLAGLAYAAGVTSQLNAWGFDAKGSEQVRALDRYYEASGIDPTGSVIALVQTDGPVDSPRGRETIKRAAEVMRAEDGIERLYLPLGEQPRPDLISQDGRAAIVLGFLRPEAIYSDAPNRLMRAYADAGIPGVTTGGEALRRTVLSETVVEDLKFAEAIALPILFLFGLFVFRGLVACLVPLAISAITIPLALSLVRLADQFSEMSVYALNLTTGLGLGLAIDYSLLIVTRFREELDTGVAVPTAVRTTVATSGRTVFFSALTVAGAAGSLMIFPQPYLYSMGFGGMSVALVSALVAIVVLPAVLFLLGERIDTLSFGRGNEERVARKWELRARRAMRRPGLVTIGVTLLVLVLASPAINARYATADDATLPPDYQARTVAETINERFSDSPLAAPAFALVEAPAESGPQLDRYVEAVEREAGVDSIAGPVYVGDGLWRVDARFAQGPFSDFAQDTVRALREAGDGDVLVAGLSAWYVDQQATIQGYLPELLAIIGLITFCVLFMMTGSVVLPIKTFILNLATIAAVYGIVVWIFQNGRLEGLFDYSSQGAIEITQPVTIFAFTFGLTTDYGVFVLSRIKELHDAGHGNEDSVALGLGRTGRVITSAALLLCVAVVTFAVSRIAFIKATGAAIGLAVAFDATIIRAMLVPALMKLLGDYNWWAPGPLRAIHRRWGWNEASNPGVPVLDEAAQPHTTT